MKSFLENLGRESVFKDGVPGMDWNRSFEKRHKEILTRRKPEILTTSRAKALTPEVRDAFYKMWEDVLEENNLMYAPHRMFNLDETGLNTDATSLMVYTKKGARDAYLKHPTCGKTMYTVLFCASASGVYMPPFVVYKAKNLHVDWAKGGPKDACYSTSDSGYMHDINFEQWFIQVFLKFVENYEKPVLLVYDGHGSHLTYQTIKAAREQSIIIICLPPHTSHAMQPLDVALFKAVKTQWKEILSVFYRESRNKRGVDKAMFPKLLAKLWPRLKAEYVVSGFRGSGLFPVDKQKVNKRMVIVIDDDNLPTPRKVMRDAIICAISPSEPVPKRGPRKRVQHTSGEVLTEAAVMDRLRQEEEDRASKKRKKAFPVKKKAFPVKKKAFPVKKKAFPVKKKTSPVKEKVKKMSRQLFLEVLDEDESDVDGDEDGKLARKERTDRWSSEGDSSDYDIDMLRESLGLDTEAENRRPVRGTTSRPCRSSEQVASEVVEEPVAGQSRSGRELEKWILTPPCEESVQDDDDDDNNVDDQDDDGEDAGGDDDGEDAGGDDDHEIRENVTYVIVNYEGTYFPGLVTKVKKASYEVSCLIKCGIRQWRFPNTPDVCEYKPNKIIQVIKAPSIMNSRQAMRCEEVEKYWGEM